jgi:hypothetical protein
MIDQKGRKDDPVSSTTPFYFPDLFLYLPFFGVIGKVAGRRWEIVWEDVGCAGVTASFIPYGVVTKEP